MNYLYFTPTRPPIPATLVQRHVLTCPFLALSPYCGRRVIHHHSSPLLLVQKASVRSSPS